ncbi:hypothetical protein [Couchioplanes azureus]|uniref:hypothetical protein n=1 Tax=Couchioplanes caeruleus TaxID=56438 RepID=UPI00166FCB00|nr:hypothetical protein [Couchioplanes caeruleus]GGQ70798.1 hypothetical protein GCM10010166_46000 [Couchioplanes caeruleus subsp. azureus]
MRIRMALALAAAGTAAAMSFAPFALADVNVGSVDVGNVDVTVTDIASGNTFSVLQNVSVQQAAQVCQVDVDVVTATLLNGQSAKCNSKTNNHQKAWIKKH